MKKLFLLDGVAGTVKGDLIKFIRKELSPNSILVEKYTTRELRTTDKYTDLKFISEQNFNIIKDKLYYYPYGEENDGYGKGDYGIDKEELKKAVDSYDNIFVIIRNLRVIIGLSPRFRQS